MNLRYKISVMFSKKDTRFYFLVSVWVDLKQFKKESFLDYAFYMFFFTVSLMDSLESTMNTTTSPQVGKGTLREAKDILEEGNEEAEYQTANFPPGPETMKTVTGKQLCPCICLQSSCIHRIWLYLPYEYYYLSKVLATFAVWILWPVKINCVLANIIIFA